MDELNTICERVEIIGPQGTLCGQLGYHMVERSAAEQAPASLPGGVLILSPHPFMGGHMDLPLLNAITNHIMALGIPTLRFDYGGVRQSEGPAFDVGSAMDTFWKTGSAPQDPILIEEARCARDWFSQQVQSPVVLVGYSFGAFVATQIRDDTTPAIGLVAPTITHHEYKGFSNDGLPTLIVSGEGDFATADAEMLAWVSSLSSKTSFEQIGGADHFFRNSSEDVAAIIAHFLQSLCTPAAKEQS